MAAADPQAFFLTPPPRHLAELRIDTVPSAVAFSAPCGAAGRNKRRCLVPASSVRKRMLLELAPFDEAPAPAPASTPPPPPSRTPSPSPTASRAGSTLSPAAEFSFDTAPRVAPPAFPGNIFAFAVNAARTPGGSEPRGAPPFLAPQGQTATPTGAAAATGVLSFLAAEERPKTPTSTGPTANGGFVFAAPPEGLPTPTSTNTSGGLSFLASPKQPLTPMGSTATGGFVASAEPSLMPAVPRLISLKPARTGSNGAGDSFAFPSPGVPPSDAAKESVPPAGLATPPSVRTASRPSPPLRKSGDGSHKRLSLFLRRAATMARRKSQRQLEEQQQQQQRTPPPQKTASAAGEASRSSVMSGSRASQCCTFFTSPSKEAAKKLETKKANSEASRSPAGSRCSSPARPATPEKENKAEYEEVSSSPRERPIAPTTCPAVLCSGAEVVVRVTCKCGIHKEFCFDHRP